MGLFSKKKGGSLFGNILASVANKVTGGVLGAKRVALLKSGEIDKINPDAKTDGKMLAEIKGTFAGQPATTEADGTIAMATPLKEVSISPEPVPTKAMFDKEPPKWLEVIGDKLSYLGGRTTEQTAVGVSDKTLLIIGGGLLAVVLVMMNNKK